MLRQKADPGQRVCNVDIGIQQLRYWLPAGAELSVAATALCELCTPSPLPGEMQQNAQRTQERLTSGCPLLAAAGRLRLRERHR